MLNRERRSHSLTNLGIETVEPTFASPPRPSIKRRWRGNTNAAHIRGCIGRCPRAQASTSSACPSCASPATAAKTCSFQPVCRRLPSMCSKSSCPRRKGFSPASACPRSTKVRFTTRSRSPATAGCWASSAKQHLAGDGIHYEPRWFRRWPAGVVGSIEIGGQRISDRRSAVRLRRRADRF